MEPVNDEYPANEDHGGNVKIDHGFIKNKTVIVRQFSRSSTAGVT
jgi:hypothetical protein